VLLQVRGETVSWPVRPRENAGSARGGPITFAPLAADARAIIDERARLIGQLRELVRRLGEFADRVEGSYPSAPAPPQADQPA
jgi:hypothetical protein